MLLIEGPHPTSMTIGSSTSGSKLGTVKNTLRTCSQRGGQRGDKTGAPEKNEKHENQKQYFASIAHGGTFIRAL